MRIEGQTVFVPWYGKQLQGNVVKENYIMGMTAVRIPLHGQHPIALFTPGHVYDTPQEEQLGNPPKISQNPPKISQNPPKISQNPPKTEEKVPIVAELSQCEVFKNSHWDKERNYLRTDSLDEFYSLWKMEHTPFGHIEVMIKEPVPEVVTKPCTKTVAKRQAEIIQLSLFD